MFVLLTGRIGKVQKRLQSRFESPYPPTFEMACLPKILFVISANTKLILVASYYTIYEQALH